MNEKKLAGLLATEKFYRSVAEVSLEAAEAYKELEAAGRRAMNAAEKTERMVAAASSAEIALTSEDVQRD